MTETVTMEALATDVRQRLDAISAEISDKTSDESIKKLVTEAIAGIPEDERRKLIFGAEQPPDRKLVGTKYARWGLSLADIEQLYDLQNSLKGQKRVDGSGVYEGPSEELRNTFAAVSEAYYLSDEQVREMDKKAIDNMFPRIPLSWFHGQDRQLAAKGKFELTGAYQRAITAAMDTSESGFGSELVGDQFVGELWTAPRRLGRVSNLIPTFEMTDPTTFLPVEVDIPEMLFVAESTTSSATNYATSKTGSNRVQVDAKKFIIHQMFSGEMDEDSIIPYLPFLRRQVALSIAHHLDSAVLNGDTTNAATGNINLDDADPADTKHYLAYDGIRHVGLVDNTGNQKDAAGAVTLNLLSAQKGRMIDSTNLVDWGHPIDMNDLVRIADPETADKIALIDEVLTVDKYGSQATILNGELARVQGNPLISSIAVSKTEADGKVSTTAANNTKGQVVGFNRRGFVLGWRRRVRTETERLPATDQTRIVHSLRNGFGRFTPDGTAGSIEAADVLFNISL